MKKITSLLLGGSLLLSACDFLSEAPTTSLPDDIALNTASDINNALYGTYNRLGTHRFLGRDVLAVGDIATDIVQHSAATTHFSNIFNYNIQPTNIYINEMWEYGYKVMDISARIIDKAPEALNNSSEAEKAVINQCVAQAYGLRALAAFYLTNYFALPYSSANVSTPGIVNVSQPIKAFQRVSRNTVGENYTQILADIEEAIRYYEMDAVENVGTSYMNFGAVQALKSRVLLYMGRYDESITAAESAITLSGAALATTVDEYKKSFTKLTPSSEDIFQIAKSIDDNLSANSLNTLYGNYGVSVRTAIIDEFSANDIRLSVLGSPWNGGKLQGITGNDQTSNLPVFRVAELYLNIAEAYALKNAHDYIKAKDNLAKVITSRDNLFDTNTLTADATIIERIKKERKLELLQEGHRFFDVRRWGERISVINGSIPNFDIAKFCYPIPADEINSGFGVTQTPNWADNLPR